MLTGGIDIGSLTAKAVIVKDGRLVSAHVQPTGIDIPKVAEQVVNAALQKANLSFDEIERFIATGYGRISIPFAAKQVTEITCNARGVCHIYPQARFIIDIGGQDTKVIKLDRDGRVLNFVMNDKCAAGTGRFLEVCADTLQIRLEELSELSLKSLNPAKISSICTVFAQTEIVSLIAKRVAREDIIAGVHEAIANRVYGLVCSLNPEDECVMTGGVAKNKAVVKALESRMRVKIQVPENPQILTALGAALIGSFTED